MTEPRMDLNDNARKLRIESWRHVYLHGTGYVLQPKST